MMRKVWLFIGVLLVLVSCKNEPTVVADPVFTDGYLVYYGPYYADKGIDADVWALELHTEGLVKDSVKGYVGTGKLITLTDIFAKNQSKVRNIPSGDYAIDTTYVAGTLIAGERKAGYDLGAYVSTYIDGNVNAIEYLDKGQMTVSTKFGITEITFDFHRRNGVKRFKATYSGVLPVYAY